MIVAAQGWIGAVPQYEAKAAAEENGDEASGEVRLDRARRWLVDLW